MRSRSVLTALVCSFLLGLSPLVAAPTIERGIDIFTTLADGRTAYDFTLSPIPAGFFCKGSKPFTGRIAFKGLPLTTEVPGQLGMAKIGQNRFQVSREKMVLPKARNSV